MRNACINAYLADMWITMICDMGETPHIMVNLENTQRMIDVPVSHVNNNKIVLNVSPSSIVNYNLDKTLGVLSFGARFNGKHFDIIVPCEAIECVNSRQSGAGSEMPKDLIFYENPSESNMDVGLPQGPDSSVEGPNGPVGPNVSGSGTPGPSPDCAGHSKPVKKDRSHLKVVK